MERKMLGLKLIDKVGHTKIREITKVTVTDAVKFVLRMKRNWAGYIDSVADNRWTKRRASLKPYGTRRRGRPL